MMVKICGITQPDQGQTIAQAGATMLGFICVLASPRYVTPNRIAEIVATLPRDNQTGEFVCDRVGVFVNPSLEQIEQTLTIANLNTVQLHGNESPEFCRQLKAFFPQIKLIKALKIKSPEDLSLAIWHPPHIDMALLDAYHPTLAGGTGRTLDWCSLRSLQPTIPWLLAGGLTPENILDALEELQPTGIDLSSGVEQSAGIKDLKKVNELFKTLRTKYTLTTR